MWLVLITNSIIDHVASHVVGGRYSGHAEGVKVQGYMAFIAKRIVSLVFSSHCIPNWSLALADRSKQTNAWCLSQTALKRFALDFP